VPPCTPTLSPRPALQAAAAGQTALAAQRLAAAAPNAPLIFKPQADLAVLDPHGTTAYSTRYNAFMAYDTLYGVDDQLNPHPQMVEGHVVENDGKLWRLKLRDGLRFHDGEPVLASDAVASIRRWWTRDAFGQVLKAMTDDLSAPSDKEIVFRLNRPFPLLPAALGKSTALVPAIIPARLITDPGKVLTEVVGSGPYRYIAAERLSGARTVWERFDGYVPRPNGVTSYTSGPKIARIRRIEWNFIPDAATASAALMNGELDWYEDPIPDFMSQFRGNRNLVVTVVNQWQAMGIRRFNMLHPPFDNPAIRRAVYAGVSQAHAMQAVAGTDPALWDNGIGIYPPESPWASKAGMGVFLPEPDYDKVKRDLKAAGYKGEKVVYLIASNNQQMLALSSVGSDELIKAGMNVDPVSLDFGSWIQRRTNQSPPEKGGWSITDSTFPGLDLWSPATHLPARGNGLTGWAGWLTSDTLEGLRNDWLTATDEAAQKVITQKIQARVFEEGAYIPTGRFKDFCVHNKSLTNLLRGMPLFYNVQKG
jgi:peptide/nickel transport system substrate-binding protein